MIATTLFCDSVEGADVTAALKEGDPEQPWHCFCGKGLGQEFWTVIPKRRIAGLSMTCR